MVAALTFNTSISDAGTGQVGGEKEEGNKGEKSMTINRELKGEFVTFALQKFLWNNISSIGLKVTYWLGHPGADIEGQSTRCTGTTA